MNLKRFIYPDLLNGSIFKSILFFTIPIITSYLFQQLYNTADTIIVGHYLREDSLAAIGACAAIFEIILFLGNGFGTGCSIVIARAFGTGDREYLKRTVAASVIIVAVVSVLIMLASFVFLRPVLVILGTPPEILEGAMSYISIVGIFSGVLFAYNFLAGMLRAIGNSFMPLIFLLLSSVLNVVLDILLITKLGMGVEGTAIATVIAQGVSVVLCIIYIFKGAKILIPHAASFKIRGTDAGRLYKELLGQGLSMALMLSIVGSGTLVLQSAINTFGKFIIAGHTAARKVFSLSSVVIFSIGMSSSTFASQNYGAGNIPRVKKGVKIAVLMTVCYGIFLTLISFFIIRPVFKFISGSENEQLLNYGTKYLQFAFPFFTVLGPLIILRNSLQGIGAKVLPLISSIVELAGKILFTLILIPHLGIWGIILCEPLIWCVMTTQLAFAFVMRIMKK
ncbi:MAG: MATE family efflux transporter [Treponema sp.]|nr:MATE family efflux transporter [Treponema sp.]